MGKRVFISYCHKQGEWVHGRLLPALRAAGCAAEIDVERGLAGQGVLGQMDAWQDQAEASLLVLTPEYLASPYRRYELDRAVAKAVVAGDSVLAELMLYPSEEFPDAWAYLSAFRGAPQQPPPANDDLRLLLKRNLLVQEAAAGDWELRVPLMRRWLRERT
jgi:hypothetical protein